MWLTGAVPSTNNKLKNREHPISPVDSLLLLQQQPGTVGGRSTWGENKEYVKGKTLPSNTTAELYEMLNQHYPGGGVQVFPDQCSIAQRLMDEDVHDHCVYDDDCVCSSVGIKGAASRPVISIEGIKGDEVVLRCQAEGCYPEPVMEWCDVHGRVLPAAGPPETSRDREGSYTVTSHVIVPKTDNNTFTCRVQQPEIKHMKERRVHIPVGKFSEVKECSDFFLEGTTPSLPGILVGGKVQDQNRYKLICQKYINSYRFATLYDTTKKIPVFSAYTFTGPPTGKRPKHQSWMIEPQLNDIKNSPEMSRDEGQSPDHQAGNNDYKNSIKEKGVNRGHLFPCSHAHDLETQKSTFTLTNIVPQVVSFNGGSWEDMEQNVIKTLQKDCLDNNGKIKAYVVTGAVPSTNNKLKNRVNIPSLLWTAYCCYNSTQRQWVAGAHWAYCCYNSNQRQWVAEAHWGENQEDVKGETLPSNTTAELYDMLKKYYPGAVKVFPDYCQKIAKQWSREKHFASWVGMYMITVSMMMNVSVPLWGSKVITYLLYCVLCW
ncbi:hypothetical protein J4Q44_G00374600 [Coregonus suidteri]|uniref:Ig-like domain-containing protein n=1 Tax=Coregonus suidteri TaxID=861788 RepID=A0AAN8KM87_9TELE